MNETGITLSDSLSLAHPFAAKDHEFNRGFIYIEETAVCRRIEQVDLNWEWKVITMTFENSMATIVGALTIKGVTRYGTGQQLAQIDANGTEKNGEAYKGATTDALKRAARLFGIGRYLLGCPKEVKGYGKELDTWLREIRKEQAEAQKDSRIIPAAPAIQTVDTPLQTAAPVIDASPKPPSWWPVLKEYKPFMPDADFATMRDQMSESVKQGTITMRDDDAAREFIERKWGLFIDMDSKRAAEKEMAS